jgi:hypothetical protein
MAKVSNSNGIEEATIADPGYGPVDNASLELFGGGNSASSKVLEKSEHRRIRNDRFKNDLNVTPIEDNPTMPSGTKS